jgi:hypothetical protein
MEVAQAFKSNTVLDFKGLTIDASAALYALVTGRAAGPKLQTSEMDQRAAPRVQPPAEPPMLHHRSYANPVRLVLLV